MLLIKWLTFAVLLTVVTSTVGSAGLKMPIHIHFLGGGFWPVK